MRGLVCYHSCGECSPAVIDSRSCGRLMSSQIFFPRNRHSEITAKNASRQDKSAHMRTFQTTQMSDRDSLYVTSQGYPPKSVGLTSMDTYRDAGDATLSFFGDSPSPVHVSPTELESNHGLIRGLSFREDSDEIQEPGKAIVSFQPNRRAAGGHIVEGGVTIVKLTEENKKKHDRRTTNVNPLVHNFTSPIGAPLFDTARSEGTDIFSSRPGVRSTAHRRAKGTPSLPSIAVRLKLFCSVGEQVSHRRYAVR